MNRALLLSSMLLAACTVDPGPVGEATATITQVPSGVACIQLQVVGSRTVTKNVDVMTGMNAVVTLSALPVGPDTFSATAFSAGCGSIAGAIANWASDPVTATVSAGGVTPVTLAMHNVGGANVGVDFPTDAGASTGPADLAGLDLLNITQLITPSSLSFGTVAVMTSSATQTLTFFNTSTSAVTVTNEGPGGVNAGDWFTPTDTCVMASVPPQGTCTVQIGFRPTGTGVRSGTYHVTTALGTVTANLAGTGQ